MTSQHRYELTKWEPYRDILPRRLVGGGWSFPFQALEARLVQVVGRIGGLSWNDGFVFEYRRRT